MLEMHPLCPAALNYFQIVDSFIKATHLPSVSPVILSDGSNSHYSAVLLEYIQLRYCSGEKMGIN